MSEAPGGDATAAGSGRDTRRRDLVIGFVMLAFAVLLWTWIIPVWGSGHGEHVITAQIVAILVGGLAGLMIVLTALGFSVEAKSAADDPFVQTSLGREPSGLYLMVAAWAAFVAALPQVGFYPAAAVVLPVSFALLGLRGPLRLALLTVGTLVVVHLVFDRGFQLRLPVGRLWM